VPSCRAGEVAENRPKQLAFHHRFRGDGVTRSVPVPVGCELEPAAVGSVPGDESNLKVFSEIPAALRLVDEVLPHMIEVAPACLLQTVIRIQIGPYAVYKEQDSRCR